LRVRLRGTPTDAIGRLGRRNIDWPGIAPIAAPISTPSSNECTLPSDTLDRRCGTSIAQDIERRRLISQPGERAFDRDIALFSVTWMTSPSGTPAVDPPSAPT